MKIRLLFAWYDLWIGAYWDRKTRTLYVLPLPMLGFRVTFYGTRCWVLVKRGLFWRPMGRGYTAELSEAWRLTEKAALEFHDDRAPVPVNERTQMVHISKFLG